MRPLFSMLRTALLLLIVASLGSGCGFVRLYGGHGSEDALRVQIVEANEQLASSLIQAQASLEQLQARAGSDAVLRDLARQYGEAVALHTVLVAEHNEETEELLDSPNRLGFIGGYRALNRGLGATVSLSNTMNDMYDAITKKVYARVAGQPFAETDTPTSRYQVVPPYYARIMERDNRLTMRQALGG